MVRHVAIGLGLILLLAWWFVFGLHLVIVSSFCASLWFMLGVFVVSDYAIRGVQNDNL